MMNGAVPNAVRRRVETYATIGSHTGLPTLLHGRTCGTSSVNEMCAKPRNRATVALDEHRRVLRLVERLHRQSKRRCEHTDTLGRVPAEQEVRDARIVSLQPDLADQLLRNQPTHRECSDRVRLTSAERSRLPLDRTLLIVLDGLAFEVATSEELERTSVGSLCFLPGVVRHGGVIDDLREAGLDGVELIQHALVPLPDRISGLVAGPFTGVTAMNVPMAPAERDQAHQLVEAIIGGLAAGELIVAELDQTTEPEERRMAKARRRVQLIRRVQFGDCLPNFFPAIDRRCMRSDGRRKQRYTETEARRAAVVLQAEGESVWAYECPGQCGRHTWHVGHTRSDLSP